MSDVLENLKKAVLEGEDKLAAELAEKALNEGINPTKIMNDGVIPGIVKAGELWKTRTLKIETRKKTKRKRKIRKPLIYLDASNIFAAFPPRILYFAPHYI